MATPNMGPEASDPNSGAVGSTAPNIKFDLENGDPSNEKSHSMAVPNNDGELDEYAGLVRYISTYREGRRKSIASVTGASEDPDEEPKKPWWAFWRKSKKSSDGGDFVAPDEWLGTDISRGLSNSDVEQRRKKTGFNELTTEKENMFLKFLSYFTGPILYGMSWCFSVAMVGKHD